MALSSIAGMIMFILGTLMLLLELIAQARKTFGAPQGGRESVAAATKDTVEAVAKLLEAFNKFSDSMQRLLLGTALMIGGLYLLSNKPF